MTASDRVRSNTRRFQQPFGLMLNSLKVPVLSGTVVRAMDEIAWAWSAEIPWTPGKYPELDALVTPFAYPVARVYLDDELVLTGYLYRVSPSLGDGGRTLVLEGASYTAELIDSCIAPGSHGYQWLKTKVLDLVAYKLLPLLGSEWASRWFTDLNKSDLPICTEPFEVIQSQPTETYAELITRLAFERNMLVTTNSVGDLVLTVAHTTDASWAKVAGDWEGYGTSPCAILLEGRPPVTSWSATYDGRQRFGKYKVYASDDLGNGIMGEATDGTIPSRRRLHVRGDDQLPGTVGQTAEWRRNLTIAESATLRLPVGGWKPPGSSQLWTPNTLVTVESPTLFLADATTLLLRSVEHVYDGDGLNAVLELVPQETYSKLTPRERWSTRSTRRPYVENALDE